MLLPSTQVFYNQYTQIMAYFYNNYNQNNPASSYQMVDIVAEALDSIKDSVYISVAPLTLSNLDLVAEASNLVTISPLYSELVSNRLNAFDAISSNLTTLNIANIPFNIDLITQGQSPANYPNFIDMFMNQTIEAIPTGMTYENFSTYLQYEANAYYAIINELSTSGVVYTGLQYDATNMFADCNQVIANNIGHISISPNENLTYAWNNLSLIPNMFKFFTMTLSDPTNPYYQSTQAFIYLIDQSYQAITNVLMSITNSSTSSLNMAVTYSNDTLMTFANRNVGDFSSWYSVAVQNNLVPPFTSNTSTQGITIASPGTSLMVPSQGAGQVVVGSTTPPNLIISNYEFDYLGTDIFIGNINEPMPPWNGDFYIIYGYPNLALSLGRRLVTAEGSLIYEPGFGSQLPSLIGGIQGLDTVGFIAVYAESALQSDPRVASVSNSGISVNASVGLVYTGTVTPNGNSSTGVTLNQIFSSVGF